MGEVRAESMANGGARPSRVVTVSATYGASGSVVAPRLADRLGLPFADRLIVARDVAPSGEHATEEERRQSTRRSFLTRLATVTGGLGLPVPTPQDLADPVREQVEQSIAELVRSGGAVILGRAAAVVLSHHAGAFHVRLDGPVDRRVARAMVLEGMDEQTCRRRQTETDRARTQYVDRLYGRDPADPSLYHLVIDATVLSADVCVDLVALAATAFWETPAAG